MASEQIRPTEIFVENTRMKEDIQNLQREMIRLGQGDCLEEGNVHDTKKLLGSGLRSWLSCGGKWKSKAKYFIVCLLVVALVTVVIFTGIRQNRVLEILKDFQKAPTAQQSSLAGVLQVGSSQTGTDSSQAASDIRNKLYVNVGMRQDYLLQECQGSEFKQSFPDLDYVLCGYNILKGFPLAVGHDPGFSYPIFKADYSKGHQTADCRYSVPHGLVIIPDVSCVTSFSSTTVQNKYEFSKSLSVAASVSGGGWGVSFSASAGYKASSSEMSTGEYVFIFSTASCNYYFSKLVLDDAPQFDDVFVRWIYRLNATNATANELDAESTYFEFFDTYGTHFPTEVTFGARFTYEYKMSSTLYETQRSRDINVAARASYSGLFSVGGGFNMDSSEREAASEFSKSVTTKTITVGAAPPANGDAMSWASEVKTSPVPTVYKLSSIEFLFTDRIMGHLNLDLERIRHSIDNQKQKYCLSLLKQGKLETCQDIVAGIEIQNTRLYNHYRSLVVASVSECIETCLREVDCEATTYCVTCERSHNEYRICHLYQQDNYRTSADEDNNWQSNIFVEKIKTIIEFENTNIIGNPRGLENSTDKDADVDKCKELCVADAYCVAFTHCLCPQKDAQCQLYSKEQVGKMEKEIGTSSFFISRRPAQKETTTAKSTATTV